MKIELDVGGLCEDVTKAVLIDALELHREHYSDEKKLLKALERVTAYFMTYHEAVEHFGRKKAERFFQ